MRTLLIAVVLLSGLGTVMAFPPAIVIDGKFDDWELVKAYPDAEGDTFGGPADATMDILSYRIANDDEFLYITVTVKEDISKGKTNRGAYQTVIDTDNKYDTGIQSDTEAPYPPHKEPLGVDRYISVETKVGQLQGIGMAGFKPDANAIGGPGEFTLPQAKCDAQVVGNRYELRADLDSLGIKLESNIRIAILHYSAANTVDWTIPAITYTVTLKSPGKVDVCGKLFSTWGEIKGTYRILDF